MGSQCAVNSVLTGKDRKCALWGRTLANSKYGFKKYLFQHIFLKNFHNYETWGEKSHKNVPMHHQGDTPRTPLDFWFLSDENSTELEQKMRQVWLCNMRWGNISQPRARKATGNSGSHMLSGGIFLHFCFCILYKRVALFRKSSCRRKQPIERISSVFVNSGWTTTSTFFLLSFVCLEFCSCSSES